ncbi:MAG TPA: cysteine desulfurase [Puia sp.]|nr:cysteine desulfurase [Puia sp.]
MKSELISDTGLLDVQKLRSDFPILSRKVNGRPLVYFDNAATTQKPLKVINAIKDYYSTINSNVHRGVHHLSQVATDAFEASRKKIAAFIGAANDHEVLFTRGTTEGINLVAYSYGRQFVNSGDEIIISSLEHHSNIVPWQMLCEERHATLKVIPINSRGELLMDSYREMLNEKVKLVSVNYVSNSFGTINPIQEIIESAHKFGIPVLIDAAQAVQHLAVDVSEMDADFMAFSGHKMYGPTGIGVLYGKEKWLNAMPPFQAGGEMIKTVGFDKTFYNDLPFKFEAGTPNIEASICLGVAIDYLNSIGLDRIRDYEEDLLQYGIDRLSTIDELQFVGTAEHKSSVISFNIDGSHPYDVGVILDQLGIAVRTGHHCTQPLMDLFGIPGTVRASLAFYNTREEIDTLFHGIQKAVQMLK